jgi:hypothetical protein
VRRGFTQRAARGGRVGIFFPEDILDRLPCLSSIVAPVTTSTTYSASHFVKLRRNTESTKRTVAFSGEGEMARTGGSMDRQRGPDSDYITTDQIVLDHGWQELDREEAIRDARKQRLPKPKRFSTPSSLAALEAVCGKPYEGTEKAWDSVMKVLQLPLRYQPAVREALSQHRWRNAQNPAGYVKSVAMRIGLKSGVNVPDWHGKLKGEVCTTSALGSNRSDKSELYRDKGVSRQEYIETLHYKWAEEPDPDSWYLESRRRELSSHGLLDRKLEVNWTEIGRRANLSREETRVLALKSKGLGRDAALETAKTEAGRKRLQCAWRNLEPDRKGQTILANVREVLNGRKPLPLQPLDGSKSSSYLPPKQALETARKRQIAPVVHETYESLNNKSYHLRWLQLAGK